MKKGRISRIDYSKDFEKSLAKAPLPIKRAWETRLALFIQDSAHPQLRNHPLTGRLKGYFSINITGDWRAIFIKQVENQRIIIIFKALGTHSQLYK